MRDGPREETQAWGLLLPGFAPGQSLVQLSPPNGRATACLALRPALLTTDRGLGGLLDPTLHQTQYPLKVLTKKHFL